MGGLRSMGGFLARQRRGLGKWRQRRLLKRTGKGSKWSVSGFLQQTPQHRTQQAISAEVARIKRLPFTEQERIGANFREGSAIFDALGAADGDATLLLRASWLRRQRAADRLPKRGDKLPPEATISADELRTIYANACGRNGRGQTLVPLIVLSHFWRARSHPDPDGKTLQLVVSALEERWRDFERCGVRDLGVFIGARGLERLRSTPPLTLLKISGSLCRTRARTMQLGA